MSTRTRAHTRTTQPVIFVVLKGGLVVKILHTRAHTRTTHPVILVEIKGGLVEKILHSHYRRLGRDVGQKRSEISRVQCDQQHPKEELG